MKIIFAGTPEISAAVLQSLLAANYSISACLTQPDRPQGRGLKLAPSPVKAIALQHNIPVLQPPSLKSMSIQNELTLLQPDLLIVLAYGLILPQAVLDIPKFGCINIHASILPRWRGAAPIQHAILAGDTRTGITTMQMDAGLDTGAILKVYPCAIEPQDTSGDLYQRLTTLAQTAILDTLNMLQRGTLVATAQEAALATYAHKITKQQARINWQQSAIEIEHSIRAYNPWPIAYTEFLDNTVRIWRAEIVKTSEHAGIAKPGTIVAVDKTGLQVATGDGIVRLLTVQFPGKKALPVIDVCHAHAALKVGASFI